jgi:hypothetical protein
MADPDAVAPLTDHPLIETAVTGPWGGPTYRYRGARIECCPGVYVCGFFLDGHPLTGQTFGVAGTITPLIDLWLDDGRLPSYMRG